MSLHESTALCWAPSSRVPQGLQGESGRWAAIEQLESGVRSYSRMFPAIMARAKGACITTEDGRQLIDFLAGAGTLNYGHNPDVIKRALLSYLEEDGIVHSLDMATPAKRGFIELFDTLILRPRNLKYKLQFPGPTGTNAVEAALKIARRVTGRHNVVAFTNAFHGVTLGSVAATGNQHFRAATGLPSLGVTFFPYDGYFGNDIDTGDYFERMLKDRSSGVDPPAAVILETVQGEGGINVARSTWLRRIEGLCRNVGALLIIDDIQMGCGRTGPFFSFEESGISPDLVLLSKSLSAYGLPLSLVLIKPEFDIWKPGEHNGTFRGNNLALVAASAALSAFWRTEAFQRDITKKGEYMYSRVAALASTAVARTASARGRGMVVGLDCVDSTKAMDISRLAFGQGLIIERCGSEDQVLKLIPPLTISEVELGQGLAILEAVALPILQA